GSRFTRELGSFSVRRPGRRPSPSRRRRYRSTRTPPGRRAMAAARRPPPTACGRSRHSSPTPSRRTSPPRWRRTTCSWSAAHSRTTTCCRTSRSASSSRCSASTRLSNEEPLMGSPYLAEIRIISFNFPPKGWAFCNGQLLPINQNQALFSILGTTYGGDGRVNFGLPNLQGSVPFHVGNAFTLGQVGGEINHTLSQSEMPAHTHVVTASSNAADQVDPTNNYWAKGSA